MGMQLNTHGLNWARVQRYNVELTSKMHQCTLNLLVRTKTVLKLCNCIITVLILVYTVPIRSSNLVLRSWRTCSIRNRCTEAYWVGHVS